MHCSLGVSVELNIIDYTSFDVARLQFQSFGSCRWPYSFWIAEAKPLKLKTQFGHKLSGSAETSSSLIADLLMSTTYKLASVTYSCTLFGLVINMHVWSLQWNNKPEIVLNKKSTVWMYFKRHKKVTSSWSIGILNWVWIVTCFYI